MVGRTPSVRLRASGRAPHVPHETARDTTELYDWGSQEPMGDGARIGSTPLAWLRCKGASTRRWLAPTVQLAHRVRAQPICREWSRAPIGHILGSTLGPAAASQSSRPPAIRLCRRAGAADPGPYPAGVRDGSFGLTKIGFMPQLCPKLRCRSASDWCSD